MKKLLIYNQSKDHELSLDKMIRDRFQIEHVLSINEVFKTYLFHRGVRDIENIPDVFLANLSDPTKEMIDFLKYVNTYRPTLKMVVVMESSRKMFSLKYIFKDRNIFFSEPDHLTDFLN